MTDSIINIVQLMDMPTRIETEYPKINELFMESIAQTTLDVEVDTLTIQPRYCHITFENKDNVTLDYLSKLTIDDSFSNLIFDFDTETLKVSDILLMESMRLHEYVIDAEGNVKASFSFELGDPHEAIELADGVALRLLIVRAFDTEILKSQL